MYKFYWDILKDGGKHFQTQFLKLWKFHDTVLTELNRDNTIIKYLTLPS